MAKSFEKIISKLIADGKLKIIDLGPANKNYHGNIVVDSYALRKYLERKRELETIYFPKIKITFP